MDHKEYENSSAGECIKTPQGYWVFFPNPLPPQLTYDNDLIKILSDADRLLGELSGTGRVLPNYLLIAPYIRREAISSSRIEENAGIFERSLFLRGGGSSRAART